MKCLLIKQTRGLLHRTFRQSWSRVVLLGAALAVGRAAATDYALSVRNINEMQAINTSGLGSTNALLVLGYYNPGDRGGGVFRWVSNSTATPDGGRYLTSSNFSSAPGRWERMLNGETANVKMWGAKGDINFAPTPSTVAAATDDSAAIQNALSAIPGSAGDNNGAIWTSELLIPAGEYKVTKTLVGTNAGWIKIRGEGAQNTLLIMPLGTNNDIFRYQSANDAIIANNGTANSDLAVRIEDLNFYFATGSGNYSVQSQHNTNNAGLVICLPQEANTIRNVVTEGGAFGIRCFFGGNGAPAAFRDVVCSDASVAGISIEPIPGASAAANFAGGHVTITGITGDHRFDESASNACLVRFVNYIGSALVDDLNAESAYGGGVIQHKFPDPSTGWAWNTQMGHINIRNCVANLGTGFNTNIASGADFLVLKGGQRTAAVTMENINLYGGKLIRDELTGRMVQFHDASASGDIQGFCRLPTSYEGLNSDPSFIRSRLVVGDKALYSFVPPTTGWYRVMGPHKGGGQWGKIGGKLTVTSKFESSEFNFDVTSSTPVSSDAAQISVVRATKSDATPPCVTQARAGVYHVGSSYYPFVDIFVAYLIGNTDNAYNLITLAFPVFDKQNLVIDGGELTLLTPTSALAGGDPAPGGSLDVLVTSNLTR